ncbi:oligopeptidase A [Motiliproteus sp. SC1-56]|uniref:oligopeptidase A n=1 Tax=Motiliproteus sp. SC1-56 TaxID=2799565 RepID=UPI001A8EDFBD|nr:oligopeptidase A [Motiliproteus sp. SC1-56]
MSNPLLEAHRFPPFSRIQPEHVEPAFDRLLAESRAELETLLADPPAGWALVERLEAIDDLLSQAWSPVSHMNSVVNSEPLREAYNAVLPKLTEYHTELGQNRRLYQAFKGLAESDEFSGLDQAQQQLVHNALRDFHLSGVDLPEAKKRRFGELKQRLSKLGSQFSENVLDATQGWTKHFSDAAPLQGLPENALAQAAQAARQQELEGYLITLEFPSYFAVMTFADNRDLRREVYEAFCTRASDQGPQGGRWDNSEAIDEILRLRHELAQLLGYENYAAYSLATKMAESTDQVVGFLNDLAHKSRPVAQAEYRELAGFARQAGVERLEAWDIGYFGEKLRQQRYALSQEELRPYFPVDRVLPGMFAVVQRLYGIEIQEEQADQLWHSDARLFRIERDGQPLGYFYLDLYARSHKRGGAWMDECRVRRRLEDGSVQLPVAYLVCNFNAPVGETPALLTHTEVSTLFHEFGHGLHHLLTRIEWAGVSGINGVAWDAVELPSQFLENWCWEPEALALISGHYQTGEPLPAELLERMLAARNFQAGMMMVRQLEFSLFDFLLHRDYRPEPATDVQALLDRVRAEVSVVTPPAFNRFQHSFSHIFAGGYAAGYYSYKWAEVLSADAFSRFEEEGIFNPETGRAFEQAILAQGGAREAMDLFVAFRGREPRVDALLRHTGITAATQEAP